MQTLETFVEPLDTSFDSDKTFTVSETVSGFEDYEVDSVVLVMQNDTDSEVNAEIAISEKSIF